MKQKKKRKAYKVKNLAPGTMAYTGKKELIETHVDIINFSPTVYDVIKSKKAEDAFDFRNKDSVTWININGLNNVLDIEKIGKNYNLHQLTLEDIVTTQQRPKLDEFEDYLYVVFKMLYYKNEVLQYEHVSLVAGEGYVITFQESDGDVFDDLRERISHGKGRIRGSGSDYLMYALLDAAVDNYFSVIEEFGDRIEDLEDDVFKGDQNIAIANNIQVLKRQILKIRRAIVPLREVISRLEKTETDFIDQKTHNFIRDLYDHIVQVNENIELYREMVWS